MSTTRFGSSWKSQQQCVNVLRAHLNRHDVALPADAERCNESEAAAIVAVDLWMWAVDADTLRASGRFGKPATRALAAALSLLCEPALPPGQVVTPPAWVPPTELFVAAEVAARHVEQWGYDPEKVLAAAANALAEGSSDPRLHAAAAVAGSVRSIT